MGRNLVVAAEVRIDAAGIAAVILLIALERSVAFDKRCVFAAGAGEQALRAADAGIALEIVLELDRLFVGTRMLVAHLGSPLAGSTQRRRPGSRPFRKAVAKLRRDD